MSILSGCQNVEQNTLATTNTVKIYRDEYGTPHIYADTTFDLFYGYGYSVAEDRLFQMEMAKRSTQGTVSEVLGASYIDFDINARTLYSPGSIKQQIAQLSAQDLDIFEGYAAGINAWIEKINKTPSTLMPKQFNDYGFAPSQWSAFDVAMIFVGTMANRFGDFNSELENAKIKQDLVARFGVEKGTDIFDDLNPRFTSNTSTSIGLNDWQAPAKTLEKYESFVSQLPEFITLGGPETSPISGFSNCYVIGKEKTEGANAILVNGPQFGWFDPAYTYSVGLHGAGFDIVGNTPFAYPVILFGHNADIGWGATWGAGDIVDLFSLELDPEQANHYFYNNESIPFEVRDEQIKVNGGEDKYVTIRRSVHGQVITYDEKNAVAISKKRSWDGNELNSMLAWLYQATASDYDEWISYADDHSLNINWYYADRSGNIAYSYTGHYPLRQTNHDNRLPAKGDGSMDWQGIQDFSNNPTALNPESHFIANWNNKPAHGVLNPDLFWYSWSSADRVDYLTDALANQDTFTPDEAWDLIEKSSYGDLVAKFLLPLINQAAVSINDNEVNDINTWLLAWDQRATDADKDGFYDQAQYLYLQRFSENLIASVLRDELQDSFVYFQTTGYPTKYKPTGSGMNLSTGLKTAYEALLKKTKFDFLNGKNANSVIAAVIKSTLSELQAEFGTEYTQWKLPLYPRPYLYKNFMGIPQNTASITTESPIEQNRGTENNMTVFYSDRIEGYEIAPPGQSGFIAPDGTASPHMYDQLSLYENFGKKRMWFYYEDVKRNAKSKVLLSIDR